MTKDKPVTRWLTGEFGAFMLLAGAGVGLLFWRLGRRLGGAVPDAAPGRARREREMKSDAGPSIGARLALAAGLIGSACVVTVAGAFLDGDWGGSDRPYLVATGVAALALSLWPAVVLRRWQRFAGPVLLAACMLLGTLDGIDCGTGSGGAVEACLHACEPLFEMQRALGLGPRCGGQCPWPRFEQNSHDCGKSPPP